MKRFQDYRVFQDAHALSLRVYGVTRQFPRDEQFGLTSQMRRAASSIPMNIAEGSVKGEREFRHALVVALGSAAELEYQFVLAKDLAYLTATDFETLEADVTAVRKMLTGFIRSIDRSLQHDPVLTTND